MRELDLGHTEAIFITVPAASIPVVANRASKSKGGAIVCTCAYVGALFLWRWCCRRSLIDFGFFLAGKWFFFSRAT